MLIINRKAGESLEIGEGVRVTVAGIDGGRVRLAIEAPKSVTILRSELVDETRKINRDAAQEQVTPAELLRMFEEPGKELTQ